MIVLNEHVGASKQDVQIQTSVAALGLVIVGADNNDQVAINANIADGTAKITISLVTASSGSKVIIPKMPLRHALNIKALYEGFFRLSAVAARGVAGTIQIGVGGALQLQNGDYVSVSIEGLTATAKTTLYSIDFEKKTNQYRFIEKIVIIGSKDVDLLSKQVLFFVKSDDGLDKVQVQYAEKSASYDQKELVLINDSMNDFVHLDTSEDGTVTKLVTGYDQLLALDVDQAYSATITPKSNTPLVAYTSAVRTTNEK